ncbi:MAG: hypothetical protein ACNA78_06180 [Balneolaceae bacterium]
MERKRAVAVRPGSLKDFWKVLLWYFPKNHYVYRVLYVVRTPKHELLTDFFKKNNPSVKSEKPVDNTGFTSIEITDEKVRRSLKRWNEQNL